MVRNKSRLGLHAQQEGAPGKQPGGMLMCNQGSVAELLLCPHPTHPNRELCEYMIRYSHPYNASPQLQLPPGFGTHVHHPSTHKYVVEMAQDAQQAGTRFL